MRLGAAFLAAVAAVALAGPARAQTVNERIRENQRRLDEIRQERSQLERQLDQLNGQAHTIASELQNIDRQKTVTGRIVNELDRQIGSLNSEMDTVTFELMMAQDALAETKAVLQGRLVEIYKRGPLWMFEVLLAAESFGDLLSRYKYLYLVSRQDRALSRQIGELRDRVQQRHRELTTVHTELARQRDDRGQELSRYLSLERRRQRALQNTEASRRSASERLSRLARDEEQLAELLATLERERNRAFGGPPTITESSIGALEWPVDGRLIYRFGREAGPDNTTLRRQGIGIAAPAGTPVRAVAGGRIEHTGPYGTYGLMVIVSHGASYRTLYLYLSRLQVQPGELIQAGDILGYSGGQSTEEGPHIEFQIRGQGAIALDPLNWLKRR
jgi:septal ring factor EnvC (AmiA/AmiB activator)